MGKGTKEIGVMGWGGLGLDPEVRVESRCDSGPDANAVIGDELKEEWEVSVFVDQFREGQ